MGLRDIPSQCVVNIVPFDTNLLDIDVADLERYAPESLIGPFPKSDQSTQGKVSFPPSNSSCHSAEIEDGSVNCGKQYDPQMNDEGCNIDEIVGTSKMEVENAWLKAELASAIAFISSFALDLDCDLIDENNIEDVLQNAAQKTAEALHLKDEYAKNLKDILKVKQMQCQSYEKRIQELEQRLFDQNMHLNKLSGSRADLEVDVLGGHALKVDDCKSETSAVTGDGRVQTTSVSSEPMDEGICVSAICMGSLKAEQSTGQTGKFQEGIDENMADFSGATLLEANCSGPMPVDTSMLEFRREEVQVFGADNSEKGKSAAQLDTKEASNDTVHASELSISQLSRRVEGESKSISEQKEGRISELQNALSEKTQQCAAIETRLAGVLEDVTSLRRELEVSLKLLDESQVNKEKISFTRFEVHELAAFVPNSAGHYEAINRNSRNYYLSEESIALFIEHVPNGRQYIIGQIVHIERNVARRPPQIGVTSSQLGNGRELSASSSGSSGLRSRSNPYGLPVGTEYFVVTVAMVPDTIHSPHP